MPLDTFLVYPHKILRRRLFLLPSSGDPRKIKAGSPINIGVNDQGVFLSDVNGVDL